MISVEKKNDFGKIEGNFSLNSIKEKVSNVQKIICGVFAGVFLDVGGRG
jgi:hypothetical protein